jgi:hypothetical protein
MISSLPIDQSLTLGTLVKSLAQVWGPHHLLPSEQQAEKAGTRRFLVLDDEDKLDGSDGDLGRVTLATTAFCAALRLCWWEIPLFLKVDI